MSKAAVFIIAFLVFFGITLVIHGLPPGDLISSYVGISEIVTTTSILGIPDVVIVNGVINGLVWGIMVFIIYALIYRTPKKRELPKMLEPTYPTTPAPRPAPVTTAVTMSRKPQEKIQRQVAKRRTYVALDKDIETIEGIGPTYGNKLRNSGVKTIGDLLREGSTRFGRRILARKVDVAPGTLLKWVCRADFFRIRGIGTQYSELLESAGVNTVTDLSWRDPKILHAKLRQVNREKNLVKRIPPLKTVRCWIENSESLRRTIEK